MRVLVCGGRDYADWNRLCGVLDDTDPPITLIIHGKARGVDTMASEWAEISGIPAIAFPASWKLHGVAAGPIRNQKMLDEGKPDLVIAFPGRKGRL